MILVVGIKREQLCDTYNDASSRGRVYNAMDIMAPGFGTLSSPPTGNAKFFD